MHADRHDEKRRRVMDKLNGLADDLKSMGPEEVHALLRDSSVFKYVQQTLQRSERIHRQLAEANLFGVGFGDSRGNITYINDEMLRMMGYTREEFERDHPSFMACIAPEFHEKLAGWGQLLRERGRISGYEWAFVRPDGGRTPYMGAAALVDGESDLHVSIALDMTQVRDAENALRQSEERRRLAHLLAQVGTFEWSIPDNKIIWSPELEALYGLDEGGFEGTYEAWRACVHPDDVGQAEGDVRLALETGNFNSQWRVARPDGSVRWLAARGQVLKDDQGRPMRMLGVNLDITEQKRIEQEEQRQRAILQKIFDTIPVMLVKWNPHLKKFILNKYSEQVFGWTTEEINERGLMETIYPDPVYRAEVARYMQSLHVGWRELELTSRSGEKIVSDWANVRLTDETMIGIGIDLRERKRAEKTLADSERRYRELVQNANSAIIRWDKDGTIIFYNEYALKLFGYTAEEVVGQHVSIIVPERESSGRDLASLIRNILEQPDQYAICVNENIAKDGRRLWINWTNKPIFDDDGNLVEMLAVGNDITEQVRTRQALERNEQHLRELNQTLEDRVAERTGMLQLLNDVAITANESENLEIALGYILKRFSEYDGWCFGHAYLVEGRDGPRLVPVRAYYENRPGYYRPFREVSMNAPLARGQGLPGRVWEKKQIQWVRDIGDELKARRAEVGHDLGIVCAVAFPIYAGEEVVGVMEFFSDHQVEATPAVTDSMVSIGTQVGRVAERQRFERELAQILADEQQRMGQDLHDTVGQEMAGLALIAERAADRADQGTPPQADMLRELAQTVRHSLNGIRSAVRGLLPPVFDSEDFPAVLQSMVAEMARQNGLTFDLHCDQQVDIPSQGVFMHLYRIASEAVTNAIKHAGAGHINLYLFVREDTIVMEIDDDGAGFDVQARPKGAGLKIMHHRAKVLGGQLEVRSRPGEGSAVICTLPISIALG